MKTSTQYQIFGLLWLIAIHTISGAVSVLQGGIAAVWLVLSALSMLKEMSSSEERSSVGNIVERNTKKSESAHPENP
jgi:hypothetical protein